MARVVVEVMPKPEILDPQGKAVTGALERLGFGDFHVRQGKRFEIELAGAIDDAALERVRQAAELLLCNTVIEDFEVHVEQQAVAEKADNAESEITDAGAAAPGSPSGPANQAAAATPGTSR